NSRPASDCRNATISDAEPKRSVNFDCMPVSSSTRRGRVRVMKYMMRTAAPNEEKMATIGIISMCDLPPIVRVEYGGGAVRVNKGPDFKIECLPHGFGMTIEVKELRS